MLPSVCDIPKIILDQIKQLTVTVLGFFISGLAVVFQVIAAIQKVVAIIRNFIQYVKDLIEGGFRLFVRLLDLANSRSLREACAKYNQLVIDFGDYSGWKEVEETLKLDCSKIPRFSIADLCALLDDVVYTEVDGVKTYRVLPRPAVVPDKVPEVSKPAVLPEQKVMVSRANIKQWWEVTTA
jgi:hypothetical protein